MWEKSFQVTFKVIVEAIILVIIFAEKHSN
jgi:hypothetical protein